MKRATAAQVAVVAGIAVLMTATVVRMYVYTSPPMTTESTVPSSSTGGTSASSASQSVAPVCGNQDSQFQPHGCWADYLGYLPTGYVLAPHYPNGAVYPCPPGMITSYCRQFVASCGNGICDPNESCNTCQIDCGADPGQTCNAYTGRVGSPIGVCQVNLNATIG
jgi:hypothetical protein